MTAEPVESSRAPGMRSWLVIGVCALVAVGFVALAALNGANIIHAGGQFEQLWRLSPGNQIGRGANSEIASQSPPLMFDADSYAWISLVREQQRTGAWRLKTYSFDNAPYGRGNHWSSGFGWWLWLLGGVTHLFTGAPLAAATATSALWANPLLFALFLVALGAAMRKPLGEWSAGILVITLASLWGMQWDFAYGRPDHHGLHLIAFLGMLLCALAGGLGWARDHQQETARRWMTGSALFGAGGLWLGAPQQCMGIGAVGVGAMLGGLIFGGAAGAARFRPELWRDWARVGAAGSVGFFLLEYFPFGMGMRLEVNHPLYALAWLGAGEWMWLLGRWRLDRRLPPAAAWLGGLALLAVATLPVAMLAGPTGWCVLRNPWITTVFGVANEGKPWLAGLPWNVIARQVWLYTGILLLSLPLAAGLLIRSKQQPPERRAALLTAGITVLAFLGWTLLQSRWMGFLEGSLAVLAVALSRCIPSAGSRTLPVVLLALTVPGWLGNGAMHFRTFTEDPMAHAKVILTDGAAVQEVAWNFRRLAKPGERPARVMVFSPWSPALHYFGGVDTVGSFYWENIAGTMAEAEFFNDPGDSVARLIARERGLDYVLAVARPEFVLGLQNLQSVRTNRDATRKSLGYRLANPLHPDPPPWLEPVEMEDSPLALNRGHRLYRVVKERLGD